MNWQHPARQRGGSSRSRGKGEAVRAEKGQTRKSSSKEGRLPSEGEERGGRAGQRPHSRPPLSPGGLGQRRLPGRGQSSAVEVLVLPCGWGSHRGLRLPSNCSNFPTSPDGVLMGSVGYARGGELLASFCPVSPLLSGKGASRGLTSSRLKETDDTVTLSRNQS